MVRETEGESAKKVSDLRKSRGTKLPTRTCTAPIWFPVKIRQIARVTRTVEGCRLRI